MSWLKKYKEGYICRQKGMFLVDNPYMPDTDDNRAWTAGWSAMNDRLPEEKHIYDYSGKFKSR
jgi:hypothetical protein